MVEKKFLITKNYIGVRSLWNRSFITLEVMQENGDSQTKIYWGTVRRQELPQADLSLIILLITVKDFTGKTLILKGCGNEAFFAGIRQVDCRFERIRPWFFKWPAKAEISFYSSRSWIMIQNGLVYKDGVYHLYFQYNPFDTRWKNMSWGHTWPWPYQLDTAGDCYVSGWKWIYVLRKLPAAVRPMRQASPPSLPAATGVRSVETAAGYGCGRDYSRYRRKDASEHRYTRRYCEHGETA